MNAPNYDFLVGIDWAYDKHDVCVLDAQGKKLAHRVFEHSGEAIEALIDWLVDLSDGQPERVAVAIETTRGALIESLMDRAIQVHAINPKQLDRFRDRHTVAGAKDDTLDAYVLADSLRTDLRLFRLVTIDDPLIIELREFSRMRDDLKQEQARDANRLREQLHRYFPQMLRLCPAADKPWFWALAELVPSPAAARRIAPARVRKLLRKYRIRRLSAEEVVAQLRTQPVKVAPGTAQAATAHVGYILPRLQLVASQMKANENRQKELLARIGTSSQSAEAEDQTPGQEPEHRDVDIILSVPGIGTNITATMLAEAPTAITNRDHGTLRTQCGVAPVTRRSNKRKVVLRRLACNPRLSDAMYHAARVHTQCEPSARQLYIALRGRGHTHGRALRTIADRLLRIVTAMLRDNTPWDATRLEGRVPSGPTANQKAAA